ncbi:hypothetical protein [Methylobacillus sp.]|uniref:hypothetical protein n=1 Tax=Methylobacillus sp. TaxID=56818 RepID=UPI0012C73E17|nr:hypothetical protein [Methylobacillus sp.]MPS48498.1 hypothetical protein [Methylobacillus sp.]
MTAPTLQEELNRKTLNAIEQIVGDQATGKITDAQAKYALDILWVSLAGLVDKDLIRMFEVFSGNLRSATNATQEVWRNPTTGVVVMMLNSMTGVLLLKTMKTGVPDQLSKTDFAAESNPTLAAKSKMESLGKYLLENGFIKL